MGCTIGWRQQKLIGKQDLFNRIGPVMKLSLVYDRAGRSEGVAYVTYESPQDAKRAVREFDGANAKGIYSSKAAEMTANTLQASQFIYSMFHLVLKVVAGIHSTQQ